MKKYINAIIIALIIFTSLSVVHAAEGKATLLLGKIEANLWESAAAIYFHIADHARNDQRIALQDYKDDIDTINRMISALETMQLNDKKASALSDIKKTWKIVKAKGDKLIQIDVEKEKMTDVSNSKMHDYWLAVEKLDHKIDELIKAVAGSH
jgi:hypothetical protein